MSRTSITAAVDIHKRIYALPGVQVMLDGELAELFSIESRALSNTFKRNIERFPSDLMFQLSDRDMKMNRSQFVTTGKNTLRSQNVSLKMGSGQHRKYFPMHLLNSVLQCWR